VKRREFVAILGAAAAWPLAGYAQQPERIRRVGVLVPWQENDTRAGVAALGTALAEFGWVEDKNIRIDYRFAAGGNPTLFKTYAAELVELSPDVMLVNGTPGLAAMREQTRTIPIVFVNVSEPVGQGFVQSLARPGGHITGFSDADALLMGKWLQLLKDLAPAVTRVAVIFNPDTAPFAALYNGAIETAAPSFGMTVTLAPVRDDAGIEEAIAAHAREPNGALIDYPQPFNATHGGAIIDAATRHRLPLMSSLAITRAGGLMSYWISQIGLFAQAASYIDRILKGASPADLPVQQPTGYKLIINLKTAKALGLPFLQPCSTSPTRSSSNSLPDRAIRTNMPRRDGGTADGVSKNYYLIDINVSIAILLQIRVVRRIGATESVAELQKQQKNGGSSCCFCSPNLAGLAETAADAESGHRYTDPRCCLLFRGPGIEEYQSLDPDRSLPRAREATAPPTEAPALLSSAEASSAQDFCRERDPLLFCGRHCACAGRNRGTACGEWINLAACGSKSTALGMLCWEGT